MKKILIFTIVLGSLISFTSCKSNKRENENMVKLNSLNATKQESNVKTLSNETYYTTTYSETLDYQYIVLDKQDKYFNLTINLDNPNDYHIFDFTLSCDDENAKILINNNYELITNTKSINWYGDNNSQYTIKLYVSSENYLNTLKLTSMFYTDREELKYSVDLNNKETINIYKINQGIALNRVDFCNFKVVKNDEHILSNSIRYNGVEIQENEIIDLSTYTRESYIYFDYSYDLNGIIYNKKQSVLASNFNLLFNKIEKNNDDVTIDTIYKCDKIEIVNKDNVVEYEFTPNDLSLKFNDSKSVISSESIYNVKAYYGAYTIIYNSDNKTTTITK